MLLPVRAWPVAVAAGLTALATSTVLSGCTDSGFGGATGTGSTTGTGSVGSPVVLPGPAPGWTPVALPAGVTVRTLTAMGDRLLIGGLADGSPPAPVMLTLDAHGASSPVPLTPTSGYAFEARWYSVTTDGTKIIAIGGANGGAHSNVRWTTWTGTAAGVKEVAQSFYAFGGWGAGDLVDAVMTPGGDALVGSWGGAKAGLDAAVWTESDDVWTRQNPAGTALESTATLLVGPRAATRDGVGILVSGSALHLVPGSVDQAAAVWRSSGVDTGWRRVDLDDPGTHSEAVSATCDEASAGACVVLGQVDGSLAVWELDGDTPKRQSDIPAIAVGDKDVVPAPVLHGSDAVVVSPDGSRTAVLVRASGAWHTSTGPAGMPAAAAAVGGRLYVATRTVTDGPTTLWAAALT